MISLALTKMGQCTDKRCNQNQDSMLLSDFKVLCISQHHYPPMQAVVDTFKLNRVSEQGTIRQSVLSACHHSHNYNNNKNKNQG